MKAWLCIFALIFTFSSADAQIVQFSGASATPPPGNCPFGTAIADGCSGAQASGHGTIANANLATPQQVIALNILGGTGYTSGGPYTWTSSGGGCSSNASGTVSVVSGIIQQSSYTISSQGAGCTSRPTIAIPSGAAGGTGGSIIPTVYQLMPHNCTSKTVCNSAIGANFNVPGVDYPVGVDTTLTLADPTAGGLPSGATFSGHTVTVASNNVTISGWNFALHGTRLAISAGVTGTTIKNNKFACIHGTTTDQSNVTIPGSGAIGTTTISNNDFNGGATQGVGCVSGGMTANVTVGGGTSSTSGTLIFEYNYCFNSDSKCLNFSGTVSNTLAITEEFNYYWNFGLCGGGCSHGEAEYSFGSSGGSSTLLSPWINQHNVMLSDFGNNGSNLTAPVAIVADGILITGADVEFNLALGQGTQSYTGSGNSNQQSTSSSVFAGHQETGVMTSGTLKNNFIDYSGGFDPYNGSGGTGSSDFPGTADFNAGSGNGCNWTTCN